MLFSYDKTSKSIKVYEETDMKTHNILERQDIEKWVEDNPEILGEELLVLTTEYDKFDKTSERLDLLAIDKDGNLVIVELKRDDSGKNVDLQAIKYAAYCSTLTFAEVVSLYQQYLSKKGEKIELDACKKKITSFVSDEFEELNDTPRIILVSKEYRPEVTASVLWLRKFGIGIRCVKLTPYELNKDTIAFESTILIPLPEAEDYIIKTEKKENTVNVLSVTKEEDIAFYEGLIKEIEPKLPVPLSAPKPKSYYSISTGIGSVHFEWAFHGRPRSSFGVELHFEKASREYNKRAMAKFESLRDEIERQTGEKVNFQSEWGTHWSRLYIEKNEGSKTDELRAWAVKNMEIFWRLLQPELDKLKS